MSNESISVSFCLLFHNQAAFVRAALEGAFAQTYSPLEIVISDDGSTDGSWELVQQLVEAYRAKGGAHQVVLNRNEPNLGMLGNRLKGFSLAHGELLVNADGDDISLPDRVAEIVAAYKANGRRAAVIAHSAIRVTPDARHALGTLKESYVMATPVGALSAYRRDVFDRFGPVQDGKLYDDAVMGFRARMVGEMQYIDKPLVLYRIGSGASSGIFGYRRQMAHLQRMWLRATEQIARDYDAFRADLGEERYQHDIRKLAEDRKRIETAVMLWDCSSFRERLRGFRVCRAPRLWSPSNLLLMVLLLPRFLSSLVFDCLRAVNYGVNRLRFGKLI